MTTAYNAAVAYDAVLPYDGIAASGAMTGSTAGVGSASGTLTGAGALAGTSAGVGASSATLAGAGALTGAGAGTGSASGTMAGAGALAAAAAGTGSASGTLTGVGALAGTAAGVGSASATAVAPTGSMVGSVAGTGSASGTLTGVGQLVGASTGVGSVSGTLRGAGALAGNAVGTSSASATATSDLAPIATTTLHTTARDLLVAAFQDNAVAAAAGVVHSSWTSRVLMGDRDGYISELHRGRLPAVEIFEEPGEEWLAPSLDRGLVNHSWHIRVHVGGISQITAEKNARAILYAGLIVARALWYFKIGSDVVSQFSASALGHVLDAKLSTQNTMTRETYETEPAAATVPVTSETAVGGISTVINYNATSPVAVLTVPANMALDTIAVQVVTVFDGVAPTVTIGIDGDQSRYFAAADSNIALADTTFEKDVDDVGARTVKVWLTPGGSTQGSLKIQISVTNA